MSLRRYWNAGLVGSTLLCAPLSFSQTAPVINDPSASAPGITQTAAPLYGRSFLLTVNGENFEQGSQIFFGDSGLATTFVNSTRLTAVVPASALGPIGSVAVKVRNPGGAVSNSVELRVVERGDINGSRSVNIGDALAAALTVAGLRKPALPIAAGDINLNGSVNIGDALILALFSGRVNVNLPTPAITAVSPNPALSGATVTLTGTGFSTTAADHRVLFTTTGNGVARVVPGEATLTSVKVTVPSNAVSGPIQVYRSDAPMGSREFALLVANTPAPLVLTEVSPFYRVLSGDSITLTGLGFDPVASNNTVLFRAASGTAIATVTAASATSLTVTVPESAVCGGIHAIVGGQTTNERAVLVAGTTCAVSLVDMLGGGAPGEIVVLEGTGFDGATPANTTVL